MYRGWGVVVARFENVWNRCGQQPGVGAVAMAAACDVGLIFLDHRFTIPNFPSRLLGYMQAKLPILACTDPNTDIGKVITEGGFGWWCESNNADAFTRDVAIIITSDLSNMKANAYRYLEDNYTSRNAYKIILNEGG